MAAQPDFAAALERYHRASELVGGIIGGITPEQLDAPTPCEQWSVRDLLAHLIGGTFASEQWVISGAPPQGRGPYELPEDYPSAFAEAGRRLEAAFAAPGVAERTYATPMGEAPGAFLVELRFNELFLHGWDLARATGRPTDFDEDLVAASRAFLERAPRFEGGPFAAPREAPAGATAADRLAAFAGRAVA